MDRAVSARRIRHRIELLNIVGNDDARDRPFDFRDANRTVYKMPDLLGSRRHVHELVRDIFEQRDEINFLLVLTTKSGAALLPDNGHDRLMVHLRVVQAVEQMNGARPGRCGAHPTSPVNFACAQAMNAASSSWRV